MLTLEPLSEFDFHRVLARSEGPVLVVFGAPGCGTCRKVEKLLPGTVAGMVSGLFKVDVQESMALARAYEVFHLPRAVFVRGRALPRTDRKRSDTEQNESGTGSGNGLTAAG